MMMNENEKFINQLEILIEDLNKSKQSFPLTGDFNIGVRNGIMIGIHEIISLKNKILNGKDN